MTEISFRTKPEPHNTQFIEAMASYNFASGMVSNRRVLDAGCGFGYGSDYLSRWADEVVGVDKDPAAIIWAGKHYRQKNVAFIPADIENAGLRDNYFDVACLFEIIHQVRECGKLLEKVRRVLKKDGTLLISTRRKHKEGPKDDPSHVQLFTAEELKALLSSAGFRDIKMYGMERPVEVEKLEKELDGMRRLVFPGLIKLIPRGLVSTLIYFTSRIKGITPPQELKYEDFRISADTASMAPGILAVCKKA